MITQSSAHQHNLCFNLSTFSDDLDFVPLCFHSWVSNELKAPAQLSRWSGFSIFVCKGVLKYSPCVRLCKSAQLWEGIWSCFWLGYSPFPSSEICYLSCHRLACITFSTSSCPSLLLHSSRNKRYRELSCHSGCTESQCRCSYYLT